MEEGFFAKCHNLYYYGIGPALPGIFMAAVMGSGVGFLGIAAFCFFSK